jgi:ATP-dependent Clp protease ATP-binding subunit ClpC
MFESFTDRARRAFILASQEAMRLRHDHIGTEHLLLGIVKEGSGLAADVLAKFNVSLPMVRQTVERLGHGPNLGQPPAKLQQTERYQRVMKYAIEEANALGNNYGGTEHVLLGLLRESEGTAARVLAALNLKLDDVRAAVHSLMGRSPVAKDSLLEQAVRDVTPKLADEFLEAKQIKAVVEALIHAGWRPPQS